MKKKSEEIFLGQRILVEFNEVTGPSEQAGMRYLITVGDMVVLDYHAAMFAGETVTAFVAGPWLFAPVTQKAIEACRQPIERAFGSLMGTKRLEYPTSNILSFDVESNGLHGESFAVGAILMCPSGVVHSTFEGRCPIKGRVDPWVAENVLPALGSVKINFRNAKALRKAFWAWFQTQKDNSIVVVDCGYPVETSFLSSCQNDDKKNNSWNGPYPLHEVATILLAVGENPDIVREEYVHYEIRYWDRHVRKHNPVSDAEVSALCALKALRELHRL